MTARNGLPNRKSGPKTATRETLLAILEQSPELSNEELARRVGVSGRRCATVLQLMGYRREWVNRNEQLTLEEK